MVVDKKTILQWRAFDMAQNCTHAERLMIALEERDWTTVDHVLSEVEALYAIVALLGAMLGADAHVGPPRDADGRRVTFQDVYEGLAGRC